MFCLYRVEWDVKLYYTIPSTFCQTYSTTTYNALVQHITGFLRQKT